MELALTIVDFGVDDLIFSANYDTRDEWKARECLGVEIEPPTSEAIGNVAFGGVPFDMYINCASKISLHIETSCI